MPSPPPPPPFVHDSQTQHESQAHPAANQFASAAVNEATAPAPTAPSTASGQHAQLPSIQTLLSSLQALQAHNQAASTTQPPTQANNHSLTSASPSTTQPHIPSTASQTSLTTQSQLPSLYAPSAASSGSTDLSQALPRWKPSEDLILLASVKQHPQGAWADIASDINKVSDGPIRTGDAAKRRYLRLKEYWTSPNAPAVPGTFASSSFAAAPVASGSGTTLAASSSSSSVAAATPPTKATRKFSRSASARRQQQKSRQKSSTPPAPSLSSPRRNGGKPWGLEEDETLAAIAQRCQRQDGIFEAFQKAMPGTTRSAAAVITRWRLKKKAWEKKAGRTGDGVESRDEGGGEGDKDQAGASQEASLLANPESEPVPPADEAQSFTTQPTLMQSWPGVSVTEDSQPSPHSDGTINNQEEVAAGAGHHDSLSQCQI